MLSFGLIAMFSLFILYPNVNAFRMGTSRLMKDIREKSTYFHGVTSSKHQNIQFQLAARFNEEGEQKDETSESIQPEISSNMRKKLLKEVRVTGGDPNYSAGPILGNPALLISLVVGFLVIVGGKGIFY